ncbi:MAG: NAD(P)H-dependent flavin oxidoreductase [Trinickia sp.]
MSLNEAPFSTALTRLLGCPHPIVCAGMGGPARAELAAAVSKAGGFGLLGMVRESPATIEREIAAVRAMTDRPFGVNLIPASTRPELFNAELDVCLRARVPAMCFFWDVVPQAIERAKEGGALVLYQVGSPDDVVQAQRAGADAIIVQGVEAGGHVRGREALMALLPEAVSRASVPVIASGGIADGAGMAAALALGASGVHCGTVFLATHESYAHDYHKQRIVDAGSGDTVHTDIYAINWPAGSPVRVLANSVTDEVRDHPFGNDPYSLPREVIARDEYGEICKYSTESPLRTTTGELEKMALFAGQSAALVRTRESAQQVIERMLREAVQAIERLKALRVTGG